MTMQRLRITGMNMVRQKGVIVRPRIIFTISIIEKITIMSSRMKMTSTQEITSTPTTSPILTILSMVQIIIKWQSARREKPSLKLKRWTRQLNSQSKKTHSDSSISSTLTGTKLWVFSTLEKTWCKANFRTMDITEELWALLMTSEIIDGPIRTK